MMTLELREVQKGLERTMLQQGTEKFWQSRQRLIDNGDSAAHGSHRKLIEDALPRVSASIRAWLTLHQAGGRGNRPAALKVLEAFDTDKLAAIGLSVCFNTLQSGDVRKVCSNIGQHVESEVWSEEFQAAQPELAARLMNRAIKKHSRPSLRKKAVKATAAKEGFEGTEWANDYRIKVGEVVLNCVLEASQVFSLDALPNDTSVLALTPDAHAVIMVTDELASWMQPTALPMVVPPRDWTSSTSGGYLTTDMVRRVTRFKLIRHYEGVRLRLLDQHIKTGQAKAFLDGINAIQATPFRINKRVLDIVEWAYGKGLSVGKLPKRDLLPRLVFPANYEELEWEAQKGWRTQAAQINEINRGIVCEAAGLRQDLWTAKMLCDFDAFWLPCNTDFRGRVYPIPHLNHHRADYIRGMIEFGVGKPIGNGGDWLMIHLANVGDFDKVSKRSFYERRHWVAENHDRILGVAADPKTNRWWIEASEPFQFLAACIEYAGWCREGSAFVSHIAVSLDGSQSGLQHYSAALRAEDDGRHVNLVPSDKPADLYSTVAAKVTRAVEAERGDQLADMWLAFGITRTVCKRAVMTFAYSSSQYGFREQLLEDLMKPLRQEVRMGKRAEHPFGDKDYAAAGYLAKKLYAVIIDTVSTAGEGMKYLQKVAGVLAHEGKDMMWTTPIGFPVLHRYSEWEIKRVELFLYDRAIKVGTEDVKDRVNEDGGVLRRIWANTRTKPKDRINKDRQRSAVAPNVIHSNDAAHLVWTVNKAQAEGITSFNLVHDAFGTHAADATRWSVLIREALIEMYSQHDLFAVIHSAAEAALSDAGREKLPAPPAKGTLDLAAIALSLYAFA
jgi:DNA-directed RNA polymerase